jgi:hypothetical protein
MALHVAEGLLGGEGQLGQALKLITYLLVEGVEVRVPGNKLDRFSLKRIFSLSYYKAHDTTSNTAQ